jgi:hypothetical protein
MVMLSYSQRQLNPYRGVMRVIRHRGAEAVTQDGWNWDLYVSNQALLEGLSDDARAHSHRILVSDIRFGRWSPEHGLKRGPIYPSADFRRMEQEGAALYAYLLQAHQAPVFPFLDIYELWLLDANSAPLALLASATDASEMDLDLPLTWRIGACARQDFACAGAVNAADALTEHVRQLATSRPAAIWVRREGDGDGDATVLGAIQGETRRLPTRLPAAAFPRYFLAETGHGDTYAQLARAYLDRQAPCLLLLPTLARDERMRLERLARARADAVEQHHRLYPELIDPAQIQAARVESMLCRKLPTRPEEYGFASMHYIELDMGDMV